MLGNYQRELEEAHHGQQYYPYWLLLHASEVRALAALGQIQQINQVIDKSLTMMSSPAGTPGEVMLEAAQELHAHGYFEAAQEIANRAVEWYQSRSAEGEDSADLARAHYIAEHWDKAAGIYEKLATRNPDNVDYKGYLGTLAVRRGDRDDARKISEALRQIDRPYLWGNHHYWRACIAALLGEREQAMTLLREAFAQGYFYGAHLHRDMNLEPLRDYAPFQELLRPKG